jgi:hypothetical protein
MDCPEEAANMDSDEHKTSPAPGGQSVASSLSSHIAVGFGLTPEEELYAAAEAMRAARSRSFNLAPSESEQSIQSGSTNTEDNAPFVFDQDMSKYPASMTSSIREHVYEGGVRYHAYKSGKYALPNDEVEQERDDMKHAMCLLLTQGAYFYAPVGPVLEAGGEVLDLGEW